MVTACVGAAEDQPQRVVSDLLHLFPASRRFLRPQHVRRSRRRELPQVSRDARERREGDARNQKSQETRPQTKKLVERLRVSFVDHGVAERKFRTSGYR